VWGAGTHVEFDQGLNYCIRQIREALGDDAESPRYVETLPRRGYRFLTPVMAGAPATPATLTRIIVLPFRQLREDVDTAYLSFSLPDAVTSSLSGLESLVVRSSLVAARYAGNAADTRAIGAETDVDVILTGTLLRSGAELRVHAQLTECASGTLLWSHTVQAPVSDLFEVQDELARGIVE
jgi:TolB-like protein